MKILVTNDDGIDALGIRIIAGWAQKLGEVTVSAPKYQQSGKSHSIEINEPFEVIKCEFMPGIPAYRIDSTPADCVRYAMEDSDGYDLVISGINNGYNIGRDILYSGTAACAFEASLYGVNSIAFSARYGYDASVAESLDPAYDFITGNKLFRYGSIYNVNIPPMPVGIALTRQGGSIHEINFEKREDSRILQSGSQMPVIKDAPGYDYNAVHKGYISVTPLTSERTDMKAYKRIKKMIDLK